jgi:hypothetical protein
MVTVDPSEITEEMLAEALKPPRRVQRPARSAKSIYSSKVRRLAQKLERLKMEALRLAVPLPHAVPFHESRKQIRLLDGSNQSAKTFHMLLEMARAVCGCDPYEKYPKTNGRAIICGYDGDHLADPIFLKLFEEGEFKIIEDEHTGEWRAVRPDPNNPKRIDPYDAAYEEKWRDAPPFIPPRMVQTIAWDQKNKNVPRVVKLVNGWKMLFRSSGSRPPRGRQVHLILIDEDIQHPQAWVPEMIPRLLRFQGRMIWAATPQEGGIELYELREKADAGSPHIESFTMLIEDNPFMSDEQREFFLSALTSEDEIAVRYYGHYGIVGRRIYPTYDPMGIHGVEPFAIPANLWARYVTLDPARRIAATVLGAVDPEEKHHYIYDAFEVLNADAATWAAKIAERQGGFRYDAFIIDQQMGQQTHAGKNENKNVARQYWEALQDAGVYPRRVGPLEGFFPGSNDIPAREKALQAWMGLRETGPFADTPVLQVMRGVSPKLDRQIKNAQTKKDDPDKRLKLQEDLVESLEYFAAFNPGYHRPIPVNVESTPNLTVFDRFQEKQRRKRSQRRSKRTFGSAVEIG